MSFFEVIVPPLDHPLTYEVPEEISPDPQIGQRVLVPLKNKIVTGYLWEEVKKTLQGPEIKPLIRILDSQPFFSPALRPFFTWIAQYYLHPIGQVLKTALPPGLTVRSVLKLQITDLGQKVLQNELLPHEDRALLKKITPKGLLFSRLAAEERESVVNFEALGWVCQTSQLNQERAKVKKEKWLHPGPCFEGRHFSEKELPLFEHLTSFSCGSLRDIKALFNLSSQRLNTLRKRGLIEIRDQVCYRDPFGEILSVEEIPLTLYPEQKKALEKIKEGLQSGEYQTFLLHGITGSGKTEIYLQAAVEALKEGKQALVLVPEIGLVPQIEGRFRLRFDDRIALLHSGLNPGERLDQWRRIQQGAAPVVIGTRSAIFAPFSNLGLIIVDEEHDASYKQTDSLRYHARDLALVRARLHSALVILGSATPSISTLYLRRQKKITYLGLTKRVRDQALPEVKVLDIKKFRRRGQIPLLSAPLEEALRQNLEKSRQALLFLNRRGFDTLILCTLCGEILKCRNCSVALTHHARQNQLLCHLCGYHIPIPQRCPQCRQEGIKPLGLGTEKVEKELIRLFPEAALDRMDRDTVVRKRSHFEILKKVRDRKTDILIGTQMITKGHDFPYVTLIGVICADLSLNWPDFRAGERTFQLLAQVAGRAGRGADPGTVYIQTYNPHHYVFKYLLLHDYLGFFGQEIRFRRELGYPPFSRLINVLFQGNRESAVKEAAGVTAGILRLEKEKSRWGDSLEILGPVPAPIARIKGKYRYQLLLKGENSRMVHKAAGIIQQAEKGVIQGKGVQIVLDVDPVDML